ncbi:MAG: LLM class F420-dependent oxidoreductase [Acidobacteriota bacterium]|nr:LLM class F420-dependent oxidoreductase [Acidobacteriota bacterium]MDE3044389.1 LLM class F420-dependent oxidoreductase [Acidobacteriota bacterium]MDE3107596.1 LLM class F420-dependent oxidoreductase [Acidobacteriota bacterium]MDE3223537.1 LLM class F420-dependent oxidoreductase [Acidobacteriota bacterium]
MELRIFCEPQQGATYDQILALARRAEEGGFGAFFRSDHYLKMGDVSGLPGPSDAWVTLAGLARDTSTIRLGTLLTSATFRLPGPLAISVAQVDAMSHGRVELGLGAGWYDQEHTAYGIPFPNLSERFEKLEEQLAIITGLWTTSESETFSFHGAHYDITDSPALPKPAQKPRPPIIVGGHGRHKTPRLAATFADEFNVPFASAEVCRDLNEVVDHACASRDRDPATLIRSAAQVVCCGATEAEVARRARAIGREVSELRENGLAGTPEELVAKLRHFESVGVSRVYLQVLDFADLDHVTLIADEVLAKVR